jgi:hypothetical protein
MEVSDMKDYAPGTDLFFHHLAADYFIDLSVSGGINF